MPELKEMKVLVIGSGPTTIGQTGECHEGALEACQALAELGCRIITVDATSDAVFNEGPWSQRPMIEPLTPKTISDIIVREKPDALLPLFGGRMGLHLVSKLYQNNTLPNTNIRLWGPSKKCLEGIRDRDTLQSALSPIGLKTPSIFPVSGVDAAIEKAQQLRFPVVLRCDDAQLLPDGRLIYNQDELNHIGTTLSGERSIKFSVEMSLLEWQQIELEVLHDQTGKSLVLGAIEYLDTAWVHPGDAISVCPPQTTPEALMVMLRKQAEAIVAHLNLIGSATLRFAYHPTRHDLLVLAVHPRYTASSAMVSRIKGIPIAKISALLVAGFSLNHFSEELRLTMPPEESAMAIGVKWPKWDFARLGKAEDRLGPQMQSTGHCIGYGDCFKEAFQKAGSGVGRDNLSISSEAEKLDHESLDALLTRLATPSSRRPFEIIAALRKGAQVADITHRTYILPWFIEQLKGLMDTACRISEYKTDSLDLALLRQAKIEGFSHSDLSRFSARSAGQIDKLLSKSGVVKNWKTLPGKNRNLLYSTFGKKTKIANSKGRKKVIILGSGAYGIGNGEECDYGIYHAAQTIHNMGYTPIIANNNAASLSSGQSTPCACYCDPLNVESIVDIVRSVKPFGIMTQFAGTAADQLATILSAKDCIVLGTPKETLQLRQNRTELKERLRQLGMPQPLFKSVKTTLEVTESADQIGFPLLISDHKFTTTKLVRDHQALDRFLAENGSMEAYPMWIEQLLEYAIEAQAEVLCDGDNAHVAAIMEHIELAGVNAGDSATVLPPYSIAPRHIETITEHCHKIAKSLSLKGLINIRFGIYRDTVYLLETAGHISRNLAMVSKTLEMPLVAWATRLILGDSLEDLNIDIRPHKKCSVRAPVFPFYVFSKVDPLLGPNMRSTGQVMALSNTFGMAYFKAMEATATPLPTKGTVLITVTDEDKSSILEPARIFEELGFNIMATKGTHKVLTEHGIKSTQVRKLGFGRPNLVDEIKNGHVQMVINTPTGGQGQIDDSVIRKAAIGSRIVNITTPASAQAAAKGIAAAIQLGL
jgi:carbamoyl-phosphate synthase large subunit